MRLATLDDGSRDGQLVVVSRDHARCAAAQDVAPNLREALEAWGEVEPMLRSLAEDLESGGAAGQNFEATSALAPLPRTWQWLDGSAFTSHGELMQRAYNLPPLDSDPPLMYQGLSHQFLSGSQPVHLPSEVHGIDFEGEFGVITDEVPIGVSAEDALAHVKLVVLINDWSLRVLGAREMKTGFGWVQGKPACSMAPIAITPEELGPAWRKGRVCLPLHVELNGEWFGSPQGEAMSVGFGELIAHAARTRSLCAGTLIGSGTVSNEDAADVGSACIAERRALEAIAAGEPRTSFLRYGDRVRMECRASGGTSLFGQVDQVVAQL